LHSATVAGFGLDDCPGHPVWREPAEWLGAPAAQRWPLHMISDQPVTQLHSQLDFSSWSMSHKVAGRAPVWMHPRDAQARGISQGDTVELFNDRGACLAGAVLTEDIRPGVVKLSTGAWWDPLEPGIPGSLDLHGNPNVLTRDVGASRLSQGCSAQSCLVQVRKAINPPTPRPFERPTLVESQTKTKFF
jgi:biotin/methionine sulfoxide reductase